MSGYDDRCREATTEQGLDEVVTYLLDDKAIDVRVEQTGGFVMVAFVFAHPDAATWEGRFPALGITASETGDGYLVCSYGTGDVGVDLVNENAPLAHVGDYACGFARVNPGADL